MWLHEFKVFFTEAGDIILHIVVLFTCSVNSNLGTAFFLENVSVYFSHFIPWAGWETLGLVLARRQYFQHPVLESHNFGKKSKQNLISHF